MSGSIRVAAARQRLALITPLRLGLGGVFLAFALAGDTAARSVVVAFLVGAAFVAFAALADRRSLLVGRPAQPEALPSGAVRDPGWRVVLDAAYPSTLGVAVLATIGLIAGNEVLGALLGGAVAGLGIASGVGLVPLVAWEREQGVRLYVGPKNSRYVA
jgi:hypothetical protein